MPRNQMGKIKYPVCPNPQTSEINITANTLFFKYFLAQEIPKIRKVISSLNAALQPITKALKNGTKAEESSLKR